MKPDDFTKRRKEFLTKSIDELLDLLSSEYLRTRFFAEMALRDLSGT